MNLQDLTFGVEVETIGYRHLIAKAIQLVTGGELRFLGGFYDTWAVSDSRSREWKVMTDASLGVSRDQQAEIVSPVLTYDDMPTLQEIIRKVRASGAKINQNCGIHIHIGANCFNPKSITNLVKIINKQEALIEYALGVSDNRRYRYCQPISEEFLTKIERTRPKTLSELNEAWYGTRIARPDHYHSSRYRGVNLHNIWYRGTIEFRWFESTLHAGKIKAYIQFILCLAIKAIKARSSSSKKREFRIESSKYDFRVFLLNLGMIGDEFKTARLHLLNRMEGSAAWKTWPRIQQPEEAVS